MRRRESITRVGGTAAARPITSVYSEPTKYELVIDHTIAKTLGLRRRYSPPPMSNVDASGTWH